MKSSSAKSVSVIIPVYNAEKYLRDCLSSVLGQTYPNLQIICINNGSTDNSLKILEEFADKDNRVCIFSQVNKGPGGARKAGFSHVTGEYVYYMDSDDQIDLSYIEIMLFTLKANSVDVVFNKNVIKVVNENMVQYHDSRTIIDDNFYSFPYVSPSVWSRLYTKKFATYCIDKIPDSIILEDVYIHYTLIRSLDTFYCFNGPSYYYRFHHNSTMSKYINSFEMISIVHMIYQFYKENNLLSKYHIPFELLYNKIESHAFKIEYQNKIRELLHLIDDDIWRYSELYHAYSLNLTKAFFHSAPNEDLTSHLRTFAMSGLRASIKTT